MTHYQFGKLSWNRETFAPIPVALPLSYSILTALIAFVKFKERLCLYLTLFYLLAFLFSLNRILECEAIFTSKCIFAIP